MERGRKKGREGEDMSEVKWSSERACSAVCLLKPLSLPLT